MTLYIDKWTSHHNQLIYSLFYYSDKKKSKFKIVYQEGIPNNGMILSFNRHNIFLDYSDDFGLIDKPNKYDFYFKRSLAPKDYKGNVKPLNFQTNFSYKPAKILTKIPKKILLKNASKAEVCRALDFFSLATNDSHQSKNLKKLWSDEITDYNGRIIFMTRLWDPARNKNPEEKERRRLQNIFRINACRVISKHFPNSITGLYPDYYAKEVASDILLDQKQTTKNNYLKELRHSDICISDDGLKDSPGWKIGEYAMNNKAIISTPINTIVENFIVDKNYKSVSSRIDYQSLPDHINELLKNRTYLEFKENSKNWSNKYLKPDAYIQNIINHCK